MCKESVAMTPLYKAHSEEAEEGNASSTLFAQPAAAATALLLYGASAGQAAAALAAILCTAQADRLLQRSRWQVLPPRPLDPRGFGGGTQRHLSGEVLLLIVDGEVTKSGASQEGFELRIIVKLMFGTVEVNMACIHSGKVTSLCQ